MTTADARLREIGKALHGTDQEIDFAAQEGTIRKILRLVAEKDVLVLGHNYMAPLVYQISGAEFRGDSLQLSRKAAESNRKIILFDGVRFMAETAKILSPGKKVLIADLAAGCSLADPFRAADVLDYRRRFPGVPVVTYFNSYADVKAESDYCCTSSNGINVVRHAAKEFGTDRVLFLPDSLMGRNVQDELDRTGEKIDVIYPGKYDAKSGRCEVHAAITAESIRNIRKQFNLPRGGRTTRVLVHWECPKEVVDEADFCGSTSGMIRHIADHPELEKVWLGTECEMTANLAAEFPQVEFVKTCQVFCEHMRKITLDKILRSLEEEIHEVTLPADLIERARKPIERMLSIR